MKKNFTLVILLAFWTFLPAFSQILPAPDRAEGDGQYGRLILRGVILIDGTGAPPIGPVDIVVEKNIITQIKLVGYPGLPISEDKRPKVGPGDKVYELEGHYLLPGFIDSHGHI